ncbi:ABC transporter ATP-binding protein [Cupriavidus sp. WS]|uniref:ABC transporter ATP-binding protein n=1 Tax=Cupriavidus sp. WS TaxID=1312922 RepID=UPI00035C9561|nr:oligopeptide/dipeptide ABC transporter ATP-binding protein [Cupriavidus sp. WS]
MSTAAAFLRAEDLRKQYQVRRGLFGKGKTLHAVAGVDFAVPAGTTFGLVGESGSGKSTLARLLLAAEPTSGGRVYVDGAPLATRTARQRKAFHRLVQPVLQDPYASLNPLMRIGDIVSEPMRIHGLAKGPALAARVDALLQSVGLAPALARRFPNELSGGQRQRVAIARALGLAPRALVLDEPVSALDVSIQAQILNLLKDLQRQQGLTYVLISHDLAVVACMSSQIGVLYLGEFVELGSRDDILLRPRHPYTRALMASSESRVDSVAQAGAAVAEIPSPIALPRGCRYQSRCPHAAPRCREQQPALRAAGATHRVACHFDL